MNLGPAKMCFVYIHDTHIDTMEGDMEVTLHIDMSNKTIMKAEVLLINSQLKMELPPHFFWALLDEDAKMIWDAAMEAVGP